MDEQRAWIKSRRKKRLRLLAAALSFCVLFTTYPDILATISALAEGGQVNENTVYVSGFSILADKVRVQTVPVGTSLSELSLPDTLMAVMIVQNSENSSEESTKDDPEKEIDPDDSDQNQEAGDENGDSEEAGDENGDSEETGEENGDSGEIGDENGAGGETGDENGSSGETGDENGAGGETEDENDAAGETGDGSDVETGDKSDGSIGESTEVTEEEQGSNEAGTGGLEVQTGGFDMPEYQSDNVITVKQLEDSSAEEPEADDGTAQRTDSEEITDSKEESVTIEGIIWESTPSYDGNTEGVYVFAPVLPEGYVLVEGISLPEITVTVVADSAQAEELRALLELLRTLPDPEEYLSYDEAADLITENQDMIDEELLSDARQATDDYLEKYPDTEADSNTGMDSREAWYASLTDFILRLEGLEHIRDTKADCMDLDCPYHYPWFVQERMAQNEAPALLTLEDLIEDYGVEAPQVPAVQTYSSRAYAAATYAEPALHPQTLMVTTDNENNSHTGTADGDIDVMIGSSDAYAAHPIEISFTLNELPAQSAYLAVKAYDVDEEYGEIDRVYLNDDIYTLTNAIGNLSGTDCTWNTTVLEIPIDRLQKGKNVISVTVPSGWVAKVDWMQLVLDGGAVDSNIEDFSLKIKDTITKGGNVTVYSDVTIKQKVNTKYVTEYTLTQESTGNALDVCFGSVAVTETVGLTMPLTSPSGMYKITGILKNPSTEEIKAIDSITFYFIKDVGVGPGASHTMTPDTLTNQSVVIRVSADQAEGFSSVTVSPASRTVTANGTYNFTVSYQMGDSEQSYTYPVKVDNIDKIAPVITYTSIRVEEDLAYAEVKELFDKALAATDNRKLAEEPFTYTLPTNISNTPGTKKVTVTAADYAGNKTTKVCEIIVTAKPIGLTMGELKAVTGSKDSYALKAVLDHTGADTITETGFVWGVMSSPTLDLKNGTVKTSTIIKTKKGTLSANATGLSFGVEYYARAYAKVKDAAGNESVVYSDAKKFGLGIPAYGTFSVSGISGNTFTITRTGGTDQSQTVYYRTVNGSAIGGTHFTHRASTVTFADGETSKKVTVTEKSVTTAYNSKTATAYSNADRTYSFEIYRVDGGGTIDQSKRSLTRTMTKSSAYTVD
ncbi:MAG: hypothetical protein K2J99_04860, partial [Lachnospiraceae bacterium]|nr:hypothetical protein [Lachnospiraceae bacterium]